MKVIVSGSNLPGAMPALQDLCLLYNLRLTVSDGPAGTLGRPRRQIDVEKVYDAYRRHRTVRGAARELGLPPGTVWDRLKQMGVLDGCTTPKEG